VFLKHWKAYKQEIANMATVRKAVGITNVSRPTQMASNANYYAVQVEGSDGKKLLCVVGKQAADYAPTGGNWEKVISGYHYVYYVQGIAPASIVLPQLKQDEQQQDGPFSGVPTFCKVGKDEICAFFEAPSSWGSQIFAWAWVTGGDGKDYVGTSWPGAEATLLGTASNGKKVFKWTANKTTAPNNIIFSGGGHQTSDLNFTNGGYYTEEGRQAVVSAE
jgi:alpha-amylase